MQTTNPPGLKPLLETTLAAPASSPMHDVAGNGKPVTRMVARKKKRRRWWILVVIVLLAATTGGWFWRRAALRAAGAAANATEVITVSRGSVERSVDSSGKVISNLDVDIKCRGSGEVIKLPFDISQSVRKGDLLCQLDPTDQELAVRQAEATVDQSAAKLAQSRDDLNQAEQNLITSRARDESDFASAKIKSVNLRAKADRQKQLTEQELGSREDLETAETEAAAADAEMHSAQITIDELKQTEIQIHSKREAVKSAEAQLRQDQVTLDTQKQQLAYATVNAPIDGVVSSLDVQLGAIVASGMSGFSGGTKIMTLSDLSHIFVIATVDESDIGQVRVGQPARITVASFPGRNFGGKVVRIATKGVNTSNVVTFEVKVEVLDEHKDLLRPEMTGNVTLIEDQRTNVLILPAGAISHDAGDKTFVTTDKGEKLPVTLGLEGSDTVEIMSGMKEGQRVVVSADELPTRWKVADKDKAPPK